MKKWHLVAAVMQLCIGIAAVVAYIVLAVGGEPLGKWTVTLIMALAYIVLGAMGIVSWIKEKKS